MKPGIVTKLVALLIAALFVFPTIVVVATSVTEGNSVTFPPKGFSLKWYEAIFQSDKWVTALGHSTVVAVLAAAIAIVVGLLLALVAARGKLVSSGIVTGIAVAPMIVPTVVSGLGFYLLAARLDLTGTVVGFALAHACLAIPFVFINVLASLTTIEKSVEEAALVSGASELSMVVRITLPLVMPAAIIGGVLAFIISWDEVIIALLMTDPQFKTAPVLVYGEIRSGARPSTSAISSLMTLVSVVVMGLIAVLPSLTKKGPRKKQNTSKNKTSSTAAKEGLEA